MELINKQDAIDGLMEDVTSYGLMDDEGNIESGCKDKDVIAMLENLQLVEAIPIEWLKEKLTGHPELPYAITDGIANVLDLWKAEQEKQNETD